MHTTHATRIVRSRRVTLGLLASLTTLAALGACVRRGRTPDGTTSAPFDVRDVDVPPRLIGCTPGAFRLPAGTPGGSAYLTAYVLVVDADGSVVPGSVRPRTSGNDGLDVQRHVGAAPEQAMLSCRYEPGVRAGRPVAVRLVTTAGAP